MLYLQWAGLVYVEGKHERMKKQLAKFTGQEGGHERDDRADAFARSIFKYLVRKLQNAGAAERAEANSGPDGKTADA